MFGSKQFGIKSKLAIVFFIVIFLCVLPSSVVLFKSFSAERTYHKQKENDLSLLSQSEYNGVFCGMFSLDNYDTADITYYKGLNTLKLNCVLKNTEDLATYLEAALFSGNEIDTIYLGINPEIIWENCKQDSQKTTEVLRSHIISFTEQNPQVQFQVILSAPSLEYWSQKTPDETDNALCSYTTVINSLDSHDNILTHFIGGEEWFIANPGNYIDHITTTADGAAKQLAFTLAHRYLITSETMYEKFDVLRSLIQQEQNAPTEYADLSSWDIVFFGDSIIGNYTGSTSVPGGVSALTGAHTFNCGIGGASASVASHYPINFPVMAEAFVTGDLSIISDSPADNSFANSLDAYNRESHSRRKLCFVLNYGVNDYINGLPVSNPQNPRDITSYAGALEEGISLLQHHYPDAAIIVMAPAFTTSFSCGTDINSEKGSVLTDYVDTAQMIAEKTNVLFMNNYLNLGINEDNAAQYLSDNIHPNDAGRFLMAQQIATQLSFIATQ